MKRKFLEDLGLEKEAIDKIMAENGTDIEAAKEKYEADIKEIKLTTAIKLAVGATAQDTDLVVGLFDKAKLILSEDGKVTGLEEQLKSLKKEKAFLFKEDKPGTAIKGGKPAEGSGTPPVDKKPDMTYSEMCAYLEANPGAKIE